MLAFISELRDTKPALADVRKDRTVATEVAHSAVAYPLGSQTQP